MNESTPSYREAPSLHPAAILVTATSLLFSGCVVTKYKSASYDTPPTNTLNLSAETRRVEAVVDTLIVPRGPGSWKSDALWDEYTLYLVNHGTRPWIIESVVLVDADGRSIKAGADPWELEDLTASWWRNAGADGLLDIQRGGGTAVLGAVGAVYGTTALIVAGVTGNPVLAAGVLGQVPAALVAAPAILLVNAKANGKARAAIEEKFHARRLRVPCTLQPGKSTRGSVYFPITPRARQLRVHTRIDGRMVELAINIGALAPMRGLEPVTQPPSSRDPNDLRIVPAVPL